MMLDWEGYRQELLERIADLGIAVNVGAALVFSARVMDALMDQPTLRNRLISAA